MMIFFTLYFLDLFHVPQQKHRFLSCFAPLHKCMFNHRKGLKSLYNHVKNVHF